MEQCYEPVVTQSKRDQETIAYFKENDSVGSFDCNICLDLVQDPVVTFCGHLYCWPCIYKWIRSQTTSCEDPDQQPCCPVCKVDVSINTLIPLYGRGQQSRKSNYGNGFPQRPNGPGCEVHTLIPTTTTTSRSSNLDHNHNGYEFEQLVHPSSRVFGLPGTTTYHWIIDMLHEMIQSWIFKNSQSNSLYMYSNTYSVASTGSTRLRRHEMLIDRSLSRVSFFLFCGIIVCLLSF